MPFQKGALIGAVLALVLGACSPAGEKADDAAAPAAKEASATLTQNDLPKPKIGKWKMTMNISGAPNPQTVEVCYTQQMIDEMQDMSAKMPNTECGEPEISREGGAFVTKLSCTSNGKSTAVITRARGDFDSRYTVDMSMVSDEGNMTTTTTAEYLGPC
jgi:hypothetical protein